MANVIEFTIKGVDKGSGVLGKFSKSAEKTVKTVTRMTAGVTAVTGAVVGFVTVMNNSLDRQAKFAKRIGVSVDQLTAMQHAADLASVPIEQFNMATQRMTRRTAEAAKGMGEASGALRELGIDAKSFSQLGIQDQMSTLADRFSKVQNNSDKLRLAFKLFDSEGTAVLQMLKDGSPALQTAAKDAAYLGVVLSKQAAANAEEFTTQMGRTQASLKGLSMGISAQLTPLMTGLLKKVTDFFAQSRPAVVTFVKDSIGNIATLGVVLGQVWARLKQFVDTVFTAKGFDAFVEGAKNAMKWVINLFIQAAPMLGKALIASFTVAWKAFSELGKWGFEKVMDVFTGNKIAGTLGDVLFKKIPEATTQTRKEVSAMWSDLGDYAVSKGTEVSDALVSTFGINVELAKQQSAEMISSLETFGTVASDQMAQVSEQQTTFMEEFYSKNTEFMNAQGELVTALADQTYDYMMTTIDAISQSIAGVIVEGGNMADALRNLGKQILKDVLGMLIKIGLQRVVTAAISNSATASQASAELAKGTATTFMNAFSSTAAIPIVGPFMAPGVAAAATAAAVAGATAAGATGSSLGATIAGAREKGGPVGMGQTYLVGEKGPELFTPRNNGTIVPNNQLGGGGGVMIDTLVIHILENATNAEALLRMSREDMREVVASRVIPALDSLAKMGVRQQYLEA